jgi:hypothetical protein
MNGWMDGWMALIEKFKKILKNPRFLKNEPG